MQTRNDPDQKRRFRARDLFSMKWNPHPVSKPTVDPDLKSLDPLTRSAESIRYSILSIEFWISPKGQVREWIRNNTRLALLLAVPAFLVLPIITFALWQFVSWFTALVSIAGKLIVFPILGLIALIVIVVVTKLIKSLFKH